MQLLQYMPAHSLGLDYSGTGLDYSWTGLGYRCAGPLSDFGYMGNVILMDVMFMKR